MTGPLERDRGVQPLDGWMTRLELSNSDLVRASADQLNFKMVQKGRKGRWLTPHVRNKILRAIAAARPEHVWTLKDLFDY